MKTIKQLAIEGKYGGCLNCGPRPSLFPPEGIIAVVFGYAALHRDDEVIFTELDAPDGEYMTGAKAEELAAADPDHDWKIILEAPLSGRTYQRHGPNEWALIEQNMGFA